MAIPILGALIGLGSTIIEGVSGVVKRRQENKRSISDKKHELKLAKLGAKVARYNAEAQAASETRQQDHDYDMQVLKNRSESYADELIIAGWFVVFIMHFIPATQPIMLGGWEAMGYDGVPWWFEFGMVGILISTLGLLKVFRIWMGRWGAKKATESASDKGE